MSSVKRLGILYGRLGLSTDTALIERRGVGVTSVSQELEATDIAPLVRRAFGLGQPASSSGFLDLLNENDPTFDVEPGDVEAALLSAAILDQTIEDGGKHSGLAALAVVTAAAGGLRQPSNHDSLISLAEAMLAHLQGAHATAPADRKYTPKPKALTEAVANIPSTQYFSQVHPNLMSALDELGKYTENNAAAAARADNDVLAYVRRLESELRLYWWVTGGWSTEAGKPFRAIGTVEAAVRSGAELSDKAFNQIGLFSAPAMLDMIIERGRNAEVLSPIQICHAATSGDAAWRRETFGVAASDPLGDLLPISTSLRLSSESDDAEDWHPRFQRMTGIAVDAALDPVALALQVYRERLAAKALA